MHPTDPGETQPGTLALLVVFVLIVGVAIGLMVNALVAMEQQPEATDTSSTQHISVITTEGSVVATNASAEESPTAIGTGDPFVSEIRLEVQASGSEPIDLSAVELHVDRPGNDVVLTHVSTAVEKGNLDPDGSRDGTAVASDVFLVQPISVESVDPVMSAGDRYQLVVPIGVFVASDGSVHVAPGAGDGATLSGREYDDDADVAVEVVSALGANEGIDNTALGIFSAAEHATITIVSPSGATASVDIEVPDSLDNSSNGTVHL